MIYTQIFRNLHELINILHSYRWQQSLLQLKQKKNLYFDLSYLIYFVFVWEILWDKKYFIDPNPNLYKKNIYNTLPFLIESPDPKASKAESISSQYTCLILSSASVRSAIRITFHIMYTYTVQYTGNKKTCKIFHNNIYIMKI